MSAGLVAEIIRSDLTSRPGGAAGSDAASRCYLVLCERSAGQYLFNILLDAAQEFGIDIEGFGISGLCILSAESRFRGSLHPLPPQV